MGKLIVQSPSKLQKGLKYNRAIYDLKTQICWQMVFLPECFDFVARTREESLAIKLTEDGEFIGRFRALAKQHGLWLALGGFHNISTSSTEKSVQIIKYLLVFYVIHFFQIDFLFLNINFKKTLFFIKNYPYF
jgi:hypothetical protein